MDSEVEIATSEVASFVDTTSEVASPDVYEGIVEMFTLRPGDEIRYGGKWFEIISVKAQPRLGIGPQPIDKLIINAYDPESNRDHRFIASPDAEWRARQVIAEMSA